MKPTLAVLFCISVFLVPHNAPAMDGTASGLILEVKSDCKVKKGKWVCKEDTKKKDTQKKDTQKKDTKKKTDKDNQKQTTKETVDTGLTACTVQEPGGGGGCKKGKWVCKTLATGEKCCGCVAEPRICCVGHYPPNEFSRPFFVPLTRPRPAQQRSKSRMWASCQRASSALQRN